jgi:hypothetical protein
LWCDQGIARRARSAVAGRSQQCRGQSTSVGHAVVRPKNRDAGWDQVPKDIESFSQGQRPMACQDLGSVARRKRLITYFASELPLSATQWCDERLEALTLRTQQYGETEEPILSLFFETQDVSMPCTLLDKNCFRADIRAGISFRFGFPLISGPTSQRLRVTRVGTKSRRT